MSSPAADTYRQELQAQMAELSPQLEGMRNDVLIQQGPMTQEILLREIGVYERRLAAIEAVLGTMDVLDADGYPAMLAVKVPREVYQDLKTDLDRQLDALGHFEPIDEAVQGHMGPGVQVPKDMTAPALADQEVS